VANAARRGWTYTFLNRTVSTTSAPLLPLVIEPRKTVSAPKLLSDGAPRTSVPGQQPSRSAI
jgi:hypothetical protein